MCTPWRQLIFLVSLYNNIRNLGQLYRRLLLHVGQIMWNVNWHLCFINRVSTKDSKSKSTHHINRFIYPFELYMDTWCVFHNEYKRPTRSSKINSHKLSIVNVLPTEDFLRKQAFQTIEFQKLFPWYFCKMTFYKMLIICLLHILLSIFHMIFYISR